MRSLLVSGLILAACGGDGGHAVGAGPDANGDDDPTVDAADDARDHDDGGTDARADGSLTPDGDSGGILTGCTQPLDPTHNTTVSSVSNLNYGIEVFRAGDRVFAIPPSATGSVWWRWTGTGWSEEPTPWPANLPAQRHVDRVVQLASGKALIVSGRFVMTFDGAAMTPPIELPAISPPWAYAQGPDGAYHVFHQALESVSKPDGTWYPAAPVPVQKLSLDPTAKATVMADGRVVIVYVDQVFGSTTPIHVHVVSRAPGQTWTADNDITPTWAVRASGPYVYAPPGGGVVVGATGAGAVVWRSETGTTFGNYESLGLINLTSVAGPCLDALVATAGYQTRYDLLRLQGTTWTILETRSLNYIDDARAAMLPDGKTFWVLGESNRVEYFATP